MKQDQIQTLTELLKEDQIFLQEPLSRHTTFRIGGPADCLVEIRRKEEIGPVIRFAEKEGLPWFILGRGSNLLVSDEGYHGIVLHISPEMNQVHIDGNRVTAQAGILNSQLASILQKEGLAGFEFAAGIPGTLGGGIYMNGGAYGGEMKDILESVTALTPSGEIVVLPKESLKLGYRDSIFQHEPLIILEAEMLFAPGDPEEILAKMQDLMDRRVSKQPLEWPSAGSVFKRPVGYFAGGLIEQAGLKGCRVGGAEVSQKHAGFIINVGGATAEDVVGLIRRIQQVVEEQTGVHLEPEMRILKEERLLQL